MLLVRGCQGYARQTSHTFLRNFSSIATPIVTPSSNIHDYAVIDVQTRPDQKAEGSRYCRKMRKGTALDRLRAMSCTLCYAPSMRPLATIILHDATHSNVPIHLYTVGMIPGIIYGVAEDKTNLSIRIMLPVKPLNKLIRDLKHGFENTVHIVRIDNDTEYTVTPRQLQIDPCTYHI